MSDPLFTLIYLSGLFPAWLVLSVAWVRCVAGSRPDSTDFCFGAFLGCMCALVWPIVVPLGFFTVLGAITLKATFRIYIALETRFEKLRRLSDEP